MKSVLTLFSRNFKSTINYYEKLGFDAIDEDKLIFYPLKFQLNLYSPADEVMVSVVGRQAANLFYFSILLDDLEDFKKRLQLNSVLIEDVQTPPIGEYLYLRDPDGNRICFYKTYF